MSEFVEVIFAVPNQDEDKWEAIFDSLLEGESGAAFQDRMEVFGEGVDSTLARLMDDDNYGPDAFNLSGWYKEDGKYVLEFDFPDTEFSKELELLFSQCPVTELKVT